jgi:hypothetical protein
MLGIRETLSAGGLSTSAAAAAAKEYERTMLSHKCEELEAKLDRKRVRIRELDIENNFYHQTTTIFLTIKKIIEKEKQFCFMLASK